MTDYSGLRYLAEQLERLEPQITEAHLMVMTSEHREQIVTLLLDGLRKLNPEINVKVETSSGEYASQLAQLRTVNNNYTFSKDYKEIYISEINSFSCRITANSHGVLVYHVDYPGVIHDVSRILAKYEINISKLNVSREQKGKMALLVSITDHEIPEDAIKQIEQLEKVSKAISLR
ncbi:ACT domain-containing protein [Brevibacillus daliensis]|uniref:ACT domain-containing protein n=1 Tax=Brevibacillus daliensis TaxID=2892995 RepID=UPI001E31DE88|nr:ACT domain-containing protein [Brevibacillus daliensis]